MTRPARILLAIPGDEHPLTAAGIERAGHLVRSCRPADVAADAEAFRPDLVVTEVGAQDTGALEWLLRRLDSGHRPLVLCLQPAGASATPILEAGADACLVRPCESADIHANVRALLRRAPWLGNAVHQVGALVVDEGSHVALFEDRPVPLTAKEFALLVALMRDAGHVVSKRSLLERLWGFDAYDENLVEVHVCGLRRHLPPAAAAMVQTERGVGYVLRAKAPQVAPA